MPLLLSLAMLAGCVEQATFAKNNVTYDRYERDKVQCATRAAQEVPVNTQVTWAPYVGIYSVDTNATLRKKNFEICMRDKGYDQVTLPYCSGKAREAATEAAASPGIRSKRMSITPKSCYINTTDGTIFVYSG